MSRHDNAYGVIDRERYDEFVLIKSSLLSTCYQDEINTSMAANIDDS